MNIIQKQFKDININQPFFDSFRESYPDFNEWADRHAEDDVCIVENKSGELVGFLKLKIEDVTEDYSDFDIPVNPDVRIKICSLKSTQPGVGSWLMWPVASLMTHNNINEVYLTTKHPEQVHKFFTKQGFTVWCHNTKTLETVYRYVHNYSPDQKEVQ